VQVKAKVMAPPKEQRKKNRCQPSCQGKNGNKKGGNKRNQNRETIAMHLSRGGSTVRVSAAE